MVVCYYLSCFLFCRNSKFRAVERIIFFFFEADFLGLFDMSLANSGHKDRIS